MMGSIRYCDLGVDGEAVVDLGAALFDLSTIVSVMDLFFEATIDVLETTGLWDSTASAIWV
jgi:hypothetical protein